jgi:WD40 repeat protein
MHSRPGVLSWSPDGERLAFIDGTLHLYDIASGKRRSADVPDPSFVSWRSAEEILVISQEDGRKHLYIVDVKSLSMQKVKLDIEPSAVFPLKNSRQLLIMSSEVKAFALGTRVRFSLFLYDLKTGISGNLFSSDRTLPAKKADINVLNAWTHAGFNNLNGSFMIMEHIKPPAARAYSQVALIDPALGTRKPIAGAGGELRKQMYASGSWSADGKRIALTDVNGLLAIFSLGDLSAPQTVKVRGLYPSWNPRGSQIYVGGFVVDSDGKNMERLLPDGYTSIAEWSPQGSRLAVVSAGELSLFDGFGPRYAGPDGPFDEKVAANIVLLKELFRNSLIGEREYEQRYDKLMRK